MKSASLLASSLALSLLMGASYGQDGPADAREDPERHLIAIGHRETSVPFRISMQTTMWSAFAGPLHKVIDAVKAKTKHPDLRVRVIPVTSQNRISLVQNGTVDLECGVTTNLVSRQKQVAFSESFFVTTRCRSSAPSRTTRRSSDDAYSAKGSSVCPSARMPKVLSVIATSA